MNDIRQNATPESAYLQHCVLETDVTKFGIFGPRVDRHVAWSSISRHPAVFLAGDDADTQTWTSRSPLQPYFELWGSTGEAIQNVQTTNWLGPGFRLLLRVSLPMPSESGPSRPKMHGSMILGRQQIRNQSKMVPLVTYETGNRLFASDRRSGLPNVGLRSRLACCEPWICPAMKSDD